MKKNPICDKITNLFVTRAIPISLLGLMTACSNLPLQVPKKLEFEHSPQSNTASVLGEQKAARSYKESDTPKAPPQRSGAANQMQTTPASGSERSDLSVAFDQMPLPTFIQAIYGGVLKTNYSMDSAVASRTDLITFHTPKPQTNAQMANLARMLLKSYGIAVQDFGGVIRIVPDNNSNSYSPQIRRGRALPDTPLSLRPVFYYVELEAVRISDFSALLKNMFGQKLQIQDDNGRNALLISGQSEDVSAAMDVIQVFDQPVMRGQRTKRIDPVFWTAEDFSKRLVDVLSAEGYAASNNIAAGTPILILPIAPLNSVILFASSDATLDHALKWARDLDRPSENQVNNTYFTYPVKFADAQALAKTLGELMGGTVSSTGGDANHNAQAATGAPAAPAARGGSKIVVNNATNSLIIQGGGADQYRQWMSLLAELDKPTKSALIDVTVAEVQAGTTDSLGVDWSWKDGAGGMPGTVNGIPGMNTDGTPSGKFTPAGAGGSQGGLSFGFLSASGLIRSKITAIANKTGNQILSSPKIMARNGETATIQVADEVPILSSTTTTPNVISGNTVTQSIQYRTAGMVLKIRPIINANSRIDLDVSQEVSNVKTAVSGSISSPTISTRKVDTKLTLKDGGTVVLAGLISNDDSSADNGVPLLKDVPGLGSLFKFEQKSVNRKELIMLITAYIINDDFEAESISNAFRNSLGDWAKDLKDKSGSANFKSANNAQILQAAPVTENKGSNNGTHPGNEPVPAQDAKSTVSVPVAEPEATPQKAPESKQGTADNPKTVNTADEKTTDGKAAAKDGADTPDGVIMSKPESKPAQSDSTSGASQKDDKKPGSKTNATKVTLPPVAPPGSKPVTNQDLLDELKRAVQR